MTETQKKQYKEKYLKYVDKYQKQLNNFADKFNLSEEEFKDVIKRHQRKLKRENASENTLELL